MGRRRGRRGLGEYVGRRWGRVVERYGVVQDGMLCRT